MTSAQLIALGQATLGRAHELILLGGARAGEHPFLARRVAVLACVLRFGFNLRGTIFASWVGLGGAVPICLGIIPALADPDRDQRLFASIFILVIASLIVQGWSVGLAA